MPTCCICFETNNKNNKKCNICLDTVVCVKCFNFMKESNIHANCPVCRSINWYTVQNVEIVIDIHSNADSLTNDGIFYNPLMCIKSCYNKIKTFIIYTCRVILTIVIIWSIGFILISLYNKNYYRYIHYPAAIFFTLITGVVFILMSFYVYKKCKNAD